MKVPIIAGGIGGIATAIALRLRNIEAELMCTYRQAPHSSSMQCDTMVLRAH